MSSATITWQLSGKELSSFLHAKNNKIYKSTPFYISSSHGSAKFQLECYSNGMNKGEEGSVDLFLKIVSLPEHASDITLRYILECVETNTTFSKIKTFNRETTNSCWPYNTLHLPELINLKIVTFMCNINILSIQYKRTKSVIGTITNYFCGNYCLKMHKYTSFTWNITDIEYDNFMNCCNRKQIHSSSFGFGDHYQLECYPNGTKLDQRGNVIMGLSLLSLPPLISSVKLFYCFKCIQCNKEWSNVHNFNYKSSVKGWPIGLIKQDLLYKITKNTKQITFKCNIEILKLYDDHNIEISPKHFHRFIVDNTQTKHIQTHGHRRNQTQSSDNSFDENIKDIEIATLNANIMQLQQTVDVLKKEIYALRDRDRYPAIGHAHGHGHGRKPMLKSHHSVHYIDSHKRRQKASKHMHPRSISDVDQLKIPQHFAHFNGFDSHRQHYVPKHRDFYPYNNSLSAGADHNNNHNVHNKHQKRKTFHGVYDYKYNNNNRNGGMEPLDDNEDDNYKNWYRDPVKQENELKKKERKKTDEGFAANIRSFAAVNNMVKIDTVKQMETNEDTRYEYNDEDDVLSDVDERKETKKTPKRIRFENKYSENSNSNPFFKERQSSVKIHDEYEHNYYDDADYDVKEGMGKFKGIEQSKSEEHRYKKNKKRKHRERVKEKEKKAFHRSKSEKHIQFYKKRDEEMVPSFEDSEQRHYHEHDIDKLRKWLCHEMGFPSKYFNLFLQNGYDNIDLIVELKEKDLIQIGIHKEKYRHRLLKEFSKYNPFQNHTIGGPPLVSGALI